MESVQEEDLKNLPDSESVAVEEGGEEEEVHPESRMASGELDRIEGKKFGTFNGVFRPTILTILGVMMYLREGWLVGNAGLLGAVSIILMAYVITGTSALAISAITTNIRLGAGGVFSIVSQSLGLEIGGSIGIPFYLAQGISTAMYIYGFMEGWQYLFPHHNATLITLSVFAFIFICSYISTSLAFRLQVIVMIGILVALGSIVMGLYQMPTPHVPQWWGGFQDESYWTLFAIFFPAATGIMVGASMSGNLKHARRSIPLGTMSAWGVSLLVYLALAVWYSMVATPEELRGDLTIAISQASWGPAVLIGILASCFNAALSSFVAAPRILQSLASHRIVPYSHVLDKLHNGEPRKATLFTGFLVLITLLLGDLNAIAQFLTMFFLLTYFTINSVLLLEQQLNLISFRPTFRIPFWVPLIGAISCLSAMIIVSPFLGLLSVLIIITIYVYLNRRGLEYPWETVRSGLLGGIATWAAKKVVTSGEKNTRRSWKPDLLVLIERRTQFEGYFRLLYSLVYPQGSIHVIALMKDRNIVPLLGLKQVVTEMQRENVFASSAIVDSTDYLSSLEAAVSIMKGSLFQPNTLFLPIQHEQHELQEALEMAKKNQLGVLLYAPHEEAGLGRGRVINLWMRDQSPNWTLDFNLSNVNLALLLGYKLLCNWKVRLRIICTVSQEEDVEKGKEFFKQLMNSARIPRRYEIHVEQYDFASYLERAPRADLNLLGLADTIDKEFLYQIVHQTKSSCLFVRDSGLESVLA